MKNPLKLDDLRVAHTLSDTHPIWHTQK